MFDGQVSVTDPLSGNPQDVLGTVDVTDPTSVNPTLFTYDHTFSGDPAGTCTSHDNTATFTTNTSGTTGSASQTVTQCVGADLAVGKTATPSFDRTYAWNIQKSVDHTRVEQVGGSATFNYTVAVGHDNGTDSNWKVKGVVTVSNPNDWETITLNNDATGLVDAIDNGGTCTFDNGSPAGAVIPKATSQGPGQATFPYTCIYSSAPNPSSFTNTATASWDKGAASTPNGSSNTATASGDFANASPNIIDGSVSVNDTLHGSLGTVSYTDPNNPTTFNYSNTVSVPFNCIQVDNTATFTTNTTGTTGKDSKTVYVCGPVKTGALTMGFWQNKNGQGIITGGASTAGVCNSGTWLRQYAPFQDLSSTATCAQVATYVTNVIKAASAAGTTMNPMLKAQMLSTALDVYFSDPALGGNKISAPAPIGGVGIDLTKVCKMIDSSGGTATCSGTYENASPAFGGAASLTVQQMLTYAAGQSNVGGSTWYANVKATQQLAKDTFDAVNNQVAFGA